MAKRDNLIWLDLEMSGLNPKRDRILEIATIVTNSQLEMIAEGPNLIIRQTPRILDHMDEWNTNQHQSSGLTELVRLSKLTAKKAEKQTLEFLLEHTLPGKSPLCGNTVYQDRKFLARYMPRLEAHFHYRHIDVSSIKELVKRWAPETAKRFERETAHRALEDIRDSIRELKFYRDEVFRI